MKNYDFNVKTIVPSVHNFFYTLFNAIEVCGPEIDRDLLQNSGLMVTCSHRSHYDYFLLGLLLQRMGVNNMRFAAGDNLTNLPLIGKKFNDLGAFPVKRGSAFDRSYINNLSNQVVGMIEDNDSIVVFPEGGRSYRGNMMEIKAGVLSASVIAQARHPKKNVYILPITISYQRLPELSALRNLLYGKKLRSDKTSFLNRLIGTIYYFGADAIIFSTLWLLRKFRIKQGGIFVDFDVPIPINELVDIQANFSPNAKDEFFAHKKSMQIVGTKIYQKLLSLYRLLPVHVVAYAIKQNSGTSLSQITLEVQRTIEALSGKKRNLQSLQKLSNNQIFDEGLRELIRIKAVSTRGDSLSVNNDLFLDYYAAAIV